MNKDGPSQRAETEVCEDYLNRFADLKSFTYKPIATEISEEPKIK